MDCKQKLFAIVSLQRVLQNCDPFDMLFVQLLTLRHSGSFWTKNVQQINFSNQLRGPIIHFVVDIFLRKGINRWGVFIFLNGTFPWRKCSSIKRSGKRFFLYSFGLIFKCCSTVIPSRKCSIKGPASKK